jgi:hypothetical protein
VQGTNWYWTYGGLTDNQKAWITRMKNNHGQKFKIFLGAGDATVLLFTSVCAGGTLTQSLN